MTVRNIHRKFSILHPIISFQLMHREKVRKLRHQGLFKLSAKKRGLNCRWISDELLGPVFQLQLLKPQTTDSLRLWMTYRLPSWLRVFSCQEEFFFIFCPIGRFSVWGSEVCSTPLRLQLRLREPPRLPTGII